MQPRFQNNKQPVGGTDPDPEPHQHYEVHCGRCHWWGYESQLKAVYKLDPLQLDGVIATPGCPICFSDHYLEYEEDDEEKLLASQKYPTSSMARLVLSARYRDKCHATVLDLLRCQTFQSEKSEEE